MQNIMPHKWNAQLLQPGEQTPWAGGSYRAHMRFVAQSICMQNPILRNQRLINQEDTG